MSAHYFGSQLPPLRPEAKGSEMRRRVLRYSALKRAHRNNARVRISNGRGVRAVWGLFALIVSLILGMTLGFFPILEAFSGGVPPARIFAADSLLYDRNGSLIADLHPDGTSRIPVQLEKISPTFRTAIVDIENKNFWTEGAVDPGRLVIAAMDYVKKGPTQGASTIPMQLAKLLFLNDDASLGYKTKEIAYANHLSNTMTKPQLLAIYLNDVSFGQGAIGIEAAAHIYFNEDASQLDLAQSSMLAGLPQAPTNYDPVLHPKAAHDRQMAVLQAMLKNGDITAAQEQQAANEKLTYGDGTADNVNLAPAFVNRVADEVSSQTGQDVYTAGLRVITTLDLKLQNAAAQIVAQQVSDVNRLNVTDGSLVSLDPITGEVVAYVGNAGPGVPGADIDLASSPRQIGSSFKLFTYSTAIGEKKVSMLTPVLDEPIHIQDGTTVWSPMDYDHKWHGILPLEEAFGNSLNIPAIRVELAAGISNIVLEARSLGVTTLTDNPSDYGASLTLGTYQVPLWELAQAATALADQGKLQTEHFVKEVLDPDGKIIYQPAPQPRQVLDPGTAYIVNAILGNDSNRWMEFGRGSDLTLAGHIVSAKTGTTDDFRDNITVGWTPHLVTAVWVGNANDAPMHGTTGITGAAPIWHQYMTQALNGVPDDWWPAPADVVQKTIGGQVGWFFNGTDQTTGQAALTGPIGINGSVSAPSGSGGAGGCSYCGGFTGGGGGGKHRKP